MRPYKRRHHGVCAEGMLLILHTHTLLTTDNLHCILDKCTALWGEPCIALQVLHVQFLWQQSAASDCNQERQRPLANRCSLSSAVSSALSCLLRSLLLRSLSCRTVSAQVLGVLSMMHTTARADRKDCRQRKRYAEAGWKVA